MDYSSNFLKKSKLDDQLKELLERIEYLNNLEKRGTIKRRANEKLLGEFEITKKTEICNVNLFVAQKICVDIPIWLVKHGSLIQSYFNKIILFRFPELCKSFKQIINSELQEALFQLVLLSRDVQNIEVASSNAISLLNSSGFQFMNRDMQGIKVPYANLSCSYFYNTNLEGSDLSNVNIAFSNLEFSSFKGCDMTDCSHGWRLLDEIKNCSEAWISPSGKYLISDSNPYYERCFNLWSLKENKIDKNQNPQQIKGNPIKFSPSEKYIIFSLSNVVLMIHNIAENTTLGHKFLNIKEFSISNSDIYLAYLSSDNILWIENLETHISSQINMDSKPVLVKWSPSDDFLFIGKYYTESILWDWRSCKEIWNNSFNFDSIDTRLEYAFSCNGKFIAIYQSRKPDNKFWILNTTTNILKSIAIKEKEQYYLQFSPVFENILFKCGPHSSLWNADAQELLANLNDFYLSDSSIIFSSCGYYIFILSAIRGILAMYDCKNNNSVRFINYYQGLTNFSISQKSSQLVMRWFNSDCVMLIDNKFISNLYEFLNKNSNLVSLACFSFDDKYLATYYKPNIKIWDMRTKSIISIIKTNEEIASMQFSPNFNELFTKNNPSEPLEAVIWNWRENKIAKKNKFLTPIRVVSFSKSGDFYAIGSGQCVYIFKDKCMFYKIESDWEKSKIYILCGSFSLCENYFMYADDSGFINFLSLINKSIEKRISIGCKRIAHISFSDNSEYIAVHDRNGNFKIWSFINEPAMIYEYNFSLNSKLQSIIWSPGGNYIILQIRDAHSFDIIDVHKGQVIYKSMNCIRYIESISWSPSGNFISAVHLGFIGIWDFSILQKLLEETNEQNLMNIECLSWENSLRQFNIRQCDFSNAIMSNENSTLLKEIQK